MNESMKDLAMRIRNELPEIEHTLKRATEGVKCAKKTGDDYYLDGVALNLHSFYSGIERVFVLIATNVDDMLPEGENWHQILLKQMAEEMTGVRPAAISDSESFFQEQNQTNNKNHFATFASLRFKTDHIHTSICQNERSAPPTHGP